MTHCRRQFVVTITITVTTANVFTNVTTNVIIATTNITATTATINSTPIIYNIIFSQARPVTRLWQLKDTFVGKLDTNISSSDIITWRMYYSTL